MKKFIAIFAIIATFGFVACNNAEKEAENTDSIQNAETEMVDTMTPPAPSTDSITVDTTTKK